MPAEYTFTIDQLRDIARFLAEEMRKEYNKPVDEVRHKVPVLAKELGINYMQVREAIRDVHYGTIYSKDKRDIFYATLTEARAYHFEGKSKKTFTKPRRINISK